MKKVIKLFLRRQHLEIMKVHFSAIFLQCENLNYYYSIAIILYHELHVENWVSHRRINVSCYIFAIFCCFSFPLFYFSSRANLS